MTEIRPVAVPDLTVRTLYKRGPAGRPVYILGSVEVDRFVLIPAEAITVVNEALRLFDGEHSIEEITHILEQRCARRVNVARLYQRLSINGLILEPKPKHVERGDIEAMSLKLLTIDVRPCFRLIGGSARTLAPVLAMISILLVAAALYFQLLDGHSKQDALRMAVHRSVRGEVVLYYSLLIGSFFFHELSHAVAATYFGLIPRRLCFSLYLGYLPMIYLRIGGTYTLDEGQRIVVWLAGVWWNFTFASVCVLMLRFVAMSPGTAHVIFVAAVANYWLAIVNLLPFMPTDGYFVLATLMKTVNIRSNAWRDLGRWIKREPSHFSSVSVGFLFITISTSVYVLLRSLRSIHSISDIRLWLTVLPIGVLIFRSFYRLRKRPAMTATANEGMG